MAEREVQHAIREAVGCLPGVVFWRNQTGFTMEDGRGIRYGLAKGSSDLIGIVDGRFVALEVKAGKGRTSKDQETFFRCVRRAGGFACAVWSVEEALAAIERSRKGEKE